MAITEEIGSKIEELQEEGLSIRSIADSLGLNREKIRRYLKGDFKKADTKLTQKQGFDTESTDTTDTTDTKAEILSDILPQIKQEVENIMSNYSIEVTKDDIMNFKTEIMTDVREAIKEEFKKINTKLIDDVVLCLAGIHNYLYRNNDGTYKNSNSFPINKRSKEIKEENERF